MAKCPYCCKEYRYVNKHSWRCAHRTIPATSELNNNNSNTSSVNNISTKNNSDSGSINVLIQNTSINNKLVTSSNNVSILNNDNYNNNLFNKFESMLSCCCGRYFRGRKGLIMHHISCKMFNSRQAISSVENTNKTINQPRSFQHKSAPATTPHPLPGVKLPKTQQQWTEANAYFHHKLNFLNNIDDIDSYTQHLQQTVYQYFADSYGTQKPIVSTSVNAKIKKLKKKLKILKTLGRNNNNYNNEIKNLSKQIRSTLRGAKLAKGDDQLNISSQLSKNFWRTCRKTFSPTTSLPPLFDVKKGSSHFGNVMKSKDNEEFNIPEWIPSLPAPSFSGNVNPPTYEEISSIIRKIRSRASPCPLDQISIIMFKRCPILKTYLHRLLSKCWVSSTIPISDYYYFQNFNARFAERRQLNEKWKGYKNGRIVLRNRVRTEDWQVERSGTRTTDSSYRDADKQTTTKSKRKSLSLK
ncbi:hypothetical protein HELRODRAFT_169046 [Helobdella robusta]|uniref:Uncharacterized protein n=1 Tax=Helobdella robusta TaxID=6412 RepID=T1F1B3_HELRO|nr:hypothetical protein HELRODRAFT_169046 [Helobdella robusta]ESO09106.1 hypothetical protein HELRODRAFT_169046 [Helobdella robusta]